MTVEHPSITASWPIAAKDGIRPSSIEKASRSRTTYDAAEVIDTVEIRCNDFHPVAVNNEHRQDAPATTYKGLYIEIWI